ncbi:hypothetical protein GCM10027271_14510 [Saccharopolyspora gloriosae]|uniref:Putative DNA-binding transcriptional regulator AlpA n=1 Tax=Saccharopolyspora gloriosae TaxID=455344 RepID=A0A840N5S6_9PSEU|nr:putative DNA-binding transcriptional regulator AlpA [Saccharopolyspora gloriosae]
MTDRRQSRRASPTGAPIPPKSSQKSATATKPPRVERRTALLTVPEFCGQMKISRSTFYEWRAKGIGPACVKLPNGGLRIRRTEADRWLIDLEDAA